jgi:hypothetical protein
MTGRGYTAAMSPIIAAIAAIIAINATAPSATAVLTRPATMRERRINTPLGYLETAAVLRDAHTEVFGAPPSMRRLAVAWAQVRLEGGASFNRNFGSVGLPDRVQDRPYVIVSGARFASLPTFRDGAALYWRTLRDGYPLTLRSFDAGDAYASGLALGHSGYHRSDIETYARLMRSLEYTFWREVAPKL